jgi:response regulator NasT
MDSVLIVSNSEKASDALKEILKQNKFSEIVSVTNCQEARRLLLDRYFDLCIINSPLTDEFGEAFARNIVLNSVSQVLFIVREEIYEDVSSKLEDYGIFTISKPINKNMLWTVLKLANAAFNKIKKLNNEKNNLQLKIEDIRLINRAKCLLIEYLGMTEENAHRYIEKEAMDRRMTKVSVAESIIKTYSK